MASIDLGIQTSKYLSGHEINGIGCLNKGSVHHLQANICVKRRIRWQKIAASMVFPATIKYPKHVAWQSVKQERWEGELEVDGYIPKWLNGTYLRNGPGEFHIGDHEVSHLLDGYATLVRLHIENGRLIMGHAQLQSEAYKAAKKNNRVCHREYSEVPEATSFFSYIKDLAGMFSGASITDNANVSVISLGDGRVMCVTETIKGSIQIDPNTLETLGRLNYTDNLRGFGFNQSGHPMLFDSELITLLPDLIKPGYNVVRMQSGTNQRTLIGRVNCKSGPTPGWVHSFAVTENYIIVPEMPLRYSLGSIFGGKLLKWHPESKAFMHVVSRATGETAASVEVPLFMTFHFINAYEEKSGPGGESISVIADCCEYNANPSILDKLTLQQLRSFSGNDVLPHSRVGRFTIPLDGSPRGKLETAMPPNEHGRGIDMCSINPKYIGKKYRYAYGCAAQRPCNSLNSLIKIDLKEKVAQSTWHDEGSVPSEPFFVGRPGAEAEDDGVVISLVSDKHCDGFALILDGSSFIEIARAKLPYGLPYGTHGCWLPKNGV